MVRTLGFLSLFNPLVLRTYWHELVHNIVLIRELTKRNFRDRYVGQIFGRVWIIFHPLLVVSIYIFLFGFVFHARMESVGTGHLSNFSIYILSGLIPWLCLLEVLSRAPTVITAQASLVKQVVFPIEVLPTVSVFAALITESVMMLLFVIYYFFVVGLPSPMWFLLPVLFLLQYLMLCGFSFGLSAFGVYLRDLKDFVQIFSSVGVYLAPIVYAPAWVPQMVKPLLFFNPFSHMAWCFQDVFYYGRFEHPQAWWVFSAFSLITFIVGYRFFRRLRPYFGSAL